MAKICPIKNNLLPTKVKCHTDCKVWLESYFYSSICAYCWHSYDNVDVDHYVPKSLDPNIRLEPYNLVLSCIACNRYYKNDYHPRHSKRKTRKTDTTGFFVFDVRRTDFSRLVEFKANMLLPQNGISSKAEEWINWNIAFFRLNTRKKLLKKRRDLLDVIKAYYQFNNNKSVLLTNLNPIQRAFIISSHKRNTRIIKDNRAFLQILGL